MPIFNFIQDCVLASNNDAGQSEVMEVLRRVEKSLKENLSATRNASRTGIDQNKQDSSDEVLQALQLVLVPALDDPPHEDVKKISSVAFW